MKVQIKNLISTRSNKPTANQYEIIVDGETYFQSYQTIIAKYDSKGLILDTKALNYSRTTSRYLYNWTGKGKQELLAGIALGTIRTTDLNL